MATKGSSAPPLFGDVLATKDPDAIQQEVFARLEQARLDQIAATQISAAEDRKVLEAAMKELADQVPPARLGRLSGLIGLVREQQSQAAAAAKAVKTAQAIPPRGWLVLGRVRDFDGTPAKGGQINFDSAGNDLAARLLKPVKIGAGGQVSFALDAGAVAEIVKSGQVQLTITAQLGDRTATDVAPAVIAADGLHQFDLILPAPKDTPTRR
jgi:hypothetical protein